MPCDLTGSTSGDFPGLIVCKYSSLRLSTGQRWCVTLAFCGANSRHGDSCVNVFQADLERAWGIHLNKPHWLTVWARCWACKNLWNTEPLLHPRPTTWDPSEAEPDTARRELSHLVVLPGSTKHKQMRRTWAEKGIRTVIWVNITTPG